MNLDEAALQADFAALVGISQQAVATHVKAGNLPPGGTYREWLLTYTERLRQEAAGRVQSEARDRRDLAIARQAEAKAALDERELYKQDGLILDLDSVRRAMMDWVTISKNEFLAAVESMTLAIESTHGITIDRTVLQPDIDAALHAIGNYRIESGNAGGRGAASMAAAA